MEKFDGKAEDGKKFLFLDKDKKPTCPLKINRQEREKIGLFPNFF
jgi:hypothetical protein